MHSKKKIVLIGAGFSSLAASAFLAKKGYEVIVLEKNDQLGGRARTWKSEGFTFDMGPSWYWMPEVFEAFYQNFGFTTSDLYKLVRLDPGYRIYFSSDDFLDIPANPIALESLFESLEKGAGLKLREFLKQAAYKYTVGMKDYVFRPSHSLLEYLDPRLLVESFKIQMLSSQSAHVARYFQNPKLKSILEFPVLFLGGTAKQIPALYSMMNYADLSLGTWYPMGGMNEIVQAMVRIAREQGVEFHINSEVKEIRLENSKAVEVVTENGNFPADFVISGADYEYTDQKLIPASYRNYSSSYWNSRVLSPSSLLFYLGLNRKIEGIRHHSLFFDESLELHADEIYTRPQWPSKPLFYACCSSVTDSSAAPEGGENLFLLMPLAPGLEDKEETREKYFSIMMDRLEKALGQDIRSSLVVKRSYAMNDFIADYHSYKGNAYGLANTLKQTAFLKPSMRSKKVENLLFTGQLTVPGPGVPPSLISGEIVAREAALYLK